LDQEEIVEALNQEKALEWHEAMVAANIDTLKRIMKNPFPKSRDWKIWRKSRRPMEWQPYLYIIREWLSVAQVNLPLVPLL
jgi:hypothetical protein